MTFNRPRRSLTVETLEHRHLMAGDLVNVYPPPAADAAYVTIVRYGEGGNVTAEVIDGRLVIRGDERPNFTTVERQSNGDYWIRGAHGVTTVNGQRHRVGIGEPTENVPLNEWVTVIEGATEGVDIDLGDGNDIVNLLGRLPAVSIRTGSGNDSVGLGGRPGTVNPPWFADTQSIKLSTAARIDGDLFIDTGDGADLVRPFAEVMGDAEIYTGTGNDFINQQPVLEFDGFVVGTTMRVAGTQVIHLGSDEEGLPDPLTESGAARLHPVETFTTNPNLTSYITPSLWDASTDVPLPPASGEATAEPTSDDPAYLFALLGDADDDAKKRS